MFAIVVPRVVRKYGLSLGRYLSRPAWACTAGYSVGGGYGQVRVDGGVPRDVRRYVRSRRGTRAIYPSVGGQVPRYPRTSAPSESVVEGPSAGIV